MIKVKHVTNKYSTNYEGLINDFIREYTTKAGWKLIDIKHSMVVDGRDEIIYSSLLIFDDSKTSDITTSLNKYGKRRK